MQCIAACPLSFQGSLEVEAVDVVFVEVERWAEHDVTVLADFVLTQLADLDFRVGRLDAAGRQPVRDLQRQSHCAA